MQLSLHIGFPTRDSGFRGAFSIAQHLRERADYNPDAVFTKSNVIRRIADAERVIRDFNRCRIKDRRAFAVYVLLPMRH